MKELKKLTEHNGFKLTELTIEMEINATAEEVWNALLQYGNVSSFHAGVKLSVPIGDYPTEADENVERTCTLVNPDQSETIIHEKIAEFEAGRFYRYEVFDWENFPFDAMFFAFSIGENDQGNTTLSLTQNYKVNANFPEAQMHEAVKMQQQGILLGYKHYLETGEKDANMQEIFAKYANV